MREELFDWPCGALKTLMSTEAADVQENCDLFTEMSPVSQRTFQENCCTYICGMLWHVVLTDRSRARGMTRFCVGYLAVEGVLDMMHRSVS